MLITHRAVGEKCTFLHDLYMSAVIAVKLLEHADNTGQHNCMFRPAVNASICIRYSLFRPLL